MIIKRVLVTPEAEAVIDQLKARYGELMFHQSGGCCDGSAPMCFEKGDFKVGGNDVRVSTICDSEFFMNTDQFEYWKYSQLIIDVTKGRGSSFSLEIPLGVRFIVKSRIFKDDELPYLEPIVFCESNY